MGRVAAGVRGISLRKADEVVDAAVVNRKAALLTVSAKGYGKRTAYDEYRIQSRGGKGIINLKVTDKNGIVVAAKSIFEGDEIMLMTRGGVVLRTAVTGESMREIGRATQGVRLMRVEDGDEITSVVKIMSEEVAFEKADQEESTAHADDVVDTLVKEGLEGHAKKISGDKKDKKAKKPKSGDGDEEE
jgi:DNA gyrase subunit A